MSRYLSFVSLLLATGVVLAGEVSEATRAPGAADARAEKQPAASEEATSEEAKNEPARDESAKKEEDAKLLSGMSVLGNQEAPKALVIVPWKTSELGRSLGITPMLDDSRQPVDREVFMRALSYYEIRSETTRHDGAPAGGRDTAGAETNAAQPATAAHRRKS
jgi:hypothetical protein